jgi:hypothetical protein
VFVRFRPVHHRLVVDDAVTEPLPLGNVGYEAMTNAKGERLIWVEAHVADRLSALRGPGESYSDVILRLVEAEAKGKP